MNLSRPTRWPTTRRSRWGACKPHARHFGERELAIRAFVRKTTSRSCHLLAAGGRKLSRHLVQDGQEGARETRLRPTAKRPPDCGAGARGFRGRRIGGRRGPAHAAAFLYDLTELQRHANRLYGFTAQRTLELARPLRAPQAAQLSAHDSPPPFAGCGRTLPRVVAAVQAPYRELLAPGTGDAPAGKAIRR